MLCDMLDIYWDGFPGFINTIAPGFTVEGAGAPMIILGEEEETKT